MEAVDPVGGDGGRGDGRGGGARGVVVREAELTRLTPCLPERKISGLQVSMKGCIVKRFRVHVCPSSATCANTSRRSAAPADRTGSSSEVEDENGAGAVFSRWTRHCLLRVVVSEKNIQKIENVRRL